MFNQCGHLITFTVLILSLEALQSAVSSELHYQAPE
jgi:hypothetical protein